ncbi:DUF6273 domain-containing protein [Tepidimicrobium xylanilyticum]
MAQPISNLPIGSKIKFGRYQVESEPHQPIVWLIAAKNHIGYPANSITLITEKIIDLRGFDAKEPSNSDSDRQRYGNNRYRDSNIRQWLNKAGLNWYVKTHTADEPPTDDGMSQPTGYDNKEGFLSSFTEDELNIILDTTLTVARNTVTDGGGSETVVDKIFLASSTEVGFENENGIAEGSLLPLFSDDASRIAYVTQQCFNNTKSGSKPSSISNGWFWWLRTLYAPNSRYVRYVGTLGGRGSYDASQGSSGVRPLCNLKSDILVSDFPDEDGCYNIIFAAVPHIITLNKAITINAGEEIEKVKFNPKINGTPLKLKYTDKEKLIYEKENLDTDTVDLEIEGKDGKIDKIAYTIS